MSEIKSWEDFLEPMEHEMKDCSIDLETSACRVDDDTRKKTQGVRTHCKIINPHNNQTIKSCDYFYTIQKKSLFLCIEFSDLLAQKTKRDESIKKVSQLEIDKSEKKQIIQCSESSKVISDELEEKFCATDFILRELYSEKSTKYIKNLPNTEYIKHFMIVYHSSNHVEDIDKARLFDRENDRMMRSLSIKTFLYLNYNRLHFLDITTFKDKYCRK